MKDKILHLNSAFSIKDLPSAADPVDSIFIEGYASTNDIDRSGDVVSASVWEAGIQNYLKNPVILAQHDHDDPIGRMVEHKIDSKGLWIKARISAAASEIFNLVKDGVLTAFSIGFRILDAEYNSAAEVFLIKEVELLEISVVSVPCNQNTLFSLAKAFDTDEAYKEFKKQFAKADTSAKGLDTQPEAESVINKEFKMDPKQIEEMLAKAAADAAAATAKAIADANAAEKAAAEKAAAEKAARDAEIAAAVKSHIEVGQSGAEKLLAEVTKRFEDQAAASKSALDGLEAALKEKAEEISRMQSSKMTFADKNKGEAVSMAEKEKAFLLSRIKGVAITETEYGRKLAEKALGAPAAVGAHLPSQTWEHEVSTNMESEIRRRLVIMPNINMINMATNVMTIPVNPEAGFATWIQNSEFGTTASPGAAQTHALKEITLNAYKVATREYLTYEEEEDAILVLLPIVRDAMIRRVARAVDKAFLLGAGTASDPVKGLAIYDATSVVTPTNTGIATIANLRALRQDLGAWGLDQSELRYIVSTDVYYNLLDDTSFQTMDKVGPQATLLTGQIGMIGQTPVLVSDAFPTKAGGAATAATNIGAICVNPANFIGGNQRGLRFDTQELVETQRRVMVASLRTGMTQMSTVNGAGVSALRWS